MNSKVPTMVMGRLVCPGRSSWEIPKSIILRSESSSGLAKTTLKHLTSRWMMLLLWMNYIKDYNYYWELYNRYLVYLETACNLSHKNLALFFCQVVGSAGSPDSKISGDWEVDRAGHTWWPSLHLRDILSPVWTHCEQTRRGPGTESHCLDVRLLRNIYIKTFTTKDDLISLKRTEASALTNCFGCLRTLAAASSPVFLSWIRWTLPKPPVPTTDSFL